MITPDGQPVGWALNSLYKTGLDDRVYGPEMMMLRVCRRAAQEDVAVYFYGSTREVLDKPASETFWGSFRICASSRTPSSRR